MIERLRKEIEERLEQLLAEAEKLRKALVALDPRGSSAPPRAASRPRRATAPAARAPASRARRRTPPGATKKRVLEALSDGKAMTAGEIAAATGLPRPSVSTMLSRLAKSGEVRKAERGYTLPAATASGNTAGGSQSGRPSA